MLLEFLIRNLILICPLIKDTLASYLGKKKCWLIQFLWKRLQGLIMLIECWCSQEKIQWELDNTLKVLKCVILLHGNYDWLGIVNLAIDFMSGIPYTFVKQQKKKNQFPPLSPYLFLMESATIWNKNIWDISIIKQIPWKISIRQTVGVMEIVKDGKIAS